MFIARRPHPPPLRQERDVILNHADNIALRWSAQRLKNPGGYKHRAPPEHFGFTSSLLRRSKMFIGSRPYPPPLRQERDVN